MVSPLLPFLSCLIYVLSVAHLAAGHGFVHSVVFGGQTYPGWNPFVDPYATPPPARVIRKVLSDGYVSSSDPDLACHHGGNNGTPAIASAPSGSPVVFQWSYWPSDHQGPISTYMTSCNGDCTTFPANDARWFKIDAVGYDSVNQQWAAAKLIANNASWTSIIPVGLAPGQYLIRFEIIALHSSTPQFYPSCSQVNVTGIGTGVPSASELTTMQALYQRVSFPNIYGASVSFTIPGPPPVSFDSNGGTSPPPSSFAAANPGTAAATPTSTSLPVATTASANQPLKQCRLVSKKAVSKT
ncbi:hypothetical protein BYT27DRAFT_7130798 [Phlegmacium glaucopus]|nr:hypothetical protein BYT27DRAFT_7130798 [Phlegmacium glaucopus]